MSNNDQQWWDGLKPGDRVIVSDGWSYTHDRIATVERVTETQIVVGQARYRKADGYLVGGARYSRSRSCVLEPTPDRVAKAERQACIRYLEGVKWAVLPTESLRRVVALLKDPDAALQAPPSPPEGRAR